ncbi:Fur family transcriptional regulator [Actomonas aquatica]|uniref:Transcriptional repressor n=1 Tax=Actomonas aquatica TaxID=2866162 RepID=A0ABZ1C585_9BACT|nr:transcriptional repressor [Opitutus sp. WL0086]WRQ86891.1 transcriptional repressor [Opitutus sp. WL0086]
MSDSIPVASANNAFVTAAAQHWQRAGQRITHVRTIICQVVAVRDVLFTADQLLPLVRAVDRGISLASIYRTLGDLSRFGLLHESRGTHDERCYAVVPPERAGTLASAVTVVCRDCGELHPLHAPCLAMRETFGVRQAGFNPRKLDLRIEADCQSLRDTGHCDRSDRRSNAKA